MKKDSSFNLKDAFMRLNHLPNLLVGLLSLSVAAQWGASYKEGDVISSNAGGTQGKYHIEYWKQNSGDKGTMTLGADCDFKCQWDYNQNILFRKGIRPGSRDLIVEYKADYNPQGNSYLSIYGWFENPLVEYYIIESWGTWKPPGGSKKSSFENDEGKYDIYQNSRTGPSIKGNTTFQQYWSVRSQKRTSGIITVGDHFKAWEAAGMKIGSFYEVSFNVEAYQSGGGSADVKVKIVPKDEYTTAASGEYFGFNRSGMTVTPGINSQTPATFYNAIGQKINGMSGRAIPLGGASSVMLKALNNASGVYYYSAEENR